MKKILTSCLIVLICLTAFITGYGKGCYSYAVNQDGTLTNDELDIAVSSWLQSHGGNLFSPQNYRARKTYEAGLIHNFIYGDGGGYDAVRNHINGGVGGNNELKFDFDGFIIQKLNTWLNRKLQNGEFGEGAELNEDGMFDDGIYNELYNGEFFTIDNGSSCLVYTDNNLNSSRNPITNLKIGTKLQYDGYDITNMINVGEYYNAEFVINGSVYRGNKTSASSNSNGLGVGYILSNERPYYHWLTDNIVTWHDVYHPQYSIVNDIKGEYCIFHTLNNNKYYVGFIGINYGQSTFTNPNYYEFIGVEIVTTNNNKENVIINFNTNNNNNVAVFPTVNEGDTLYITPKVNVGVDGEVNYQPYIINEGDNISNVINQYYIDSNTPDKTISYPTTDPNDTGGNDNPSGGTLPNWDNPYPNLSPDGEGGFNFNFNLPDLNIDWNISGLKDKFPFSIPFDLIHFVEVLNATPETPEFDWTIDLKIYQWHIDADLHQFDNLAGIVRNVEFIGFCITLIMITRRMIKG